jgi:hypothetical protein
MSPGTAMRRRFAFLAWAAALVVAGQPARGQEDPFDDLDQALTFSGLGDQLHARISGTLDLEGYYTSLEEPALFETESHGVFNPRLSLFLDAQLGTHLYAFVQARADDGFDPGDPGPGVRLDEYVLRLAPFDDARLNLQLGKFATVVGNWTRRHGSWENPFITAPLPYENLTGVWDTTAVRSVPQLQFWGGILPHPNTSGQFVDQYRNIPVIWGPSYASGAAVLGAAGPLDYAVEVKNTSLSSRPETWAPTQTQWQNPTVSGRLGYTPDAMWNLGVSASAGPYLLPSVAGALPAGRSLDQYLELVIGEDASFAWHHVQVWAEAYEARFEIPGVGNADTLAYYVEAKYRFTPQFSGALRWNQQVFEPLAVPAGADGAWSRDVTRVDVGPCYRLTAHAEVKVQYSIEHQRADMGEWSSLAAVQLTVRF